MPLSPATLDTRRWADLVEEARTRLPRSAPAWTDHNAHDPGVTLLELFAYLVEQDVYRVNRVPDANRRALLGLVGARPRGPRPAHGILAIRATATTPVLPEGIVVEGPGGVGCRTTAALRPTRARLAAVVVGGPDGQTAGQLDVTRALLAGEPVAALGPDPAEGSALTLGFDGALPTNQPIAIGLALNGGGTDAEVGIDTADRNDLLHHDVTMAWEVRVGGAWLALDRAAVDDPTRSLTRSGVVTLTLSSGAAPEVLAPIGRPLSWLRCRVVGGQHDAAPVLLSAAIDAVPVVFAVPVHASYRIAIGTVVPPELVPGMVSVAMRLDARGEIVHLEAGSALGTPPVRVLVVGAPTGHLSGNVTVEAVVLGTGDGRPGQRFSLPGGPFVDGSMAVWSAGPVTPGPLRLAPTLSAFHSAAAAAVADPVSGDVVVGDDCHAATAPVGDILLGAAEAVSVSSPDRLGAGVSFALRHDPRTTVLLGEPADAVAATIDLITLLGPTWGGSDAEDVDAAAGRAGARLWAHERLAALLEAAQVTTLDDVDAALARSVMVPERAATLADLERVALGVPGTRVARARAIARQDPRYHCIDAAGAVTVVVVPFLPAARPVPTTGLLAAVRAAIDARRLVGMQVHIAGPTYVEVVVQLRLAVLPGSSADAVVTAVESAVREHLHPLTGGPAGTGWPFGRDVQRADVLQVVDAVAGVDHVLSLDLGTSDNAVTCGAVCVPPGALVVAGRVSVVAG